jgi:uncharacterized protein (TIGR00288 family)
MNERKKIALLIDYDNFNQEKYFPVLFSELSERGDTIIKYAFYSNFDDKTIRDKFIRLNIEPIAQIPYSTGKNAVDIRISIEAMDLLNKDFIDCFCLATNDSDFTPLVKRLQKDNKTVIGAGDDRANQAFINVCDSFISVEKIIKSRTVTKEDKKNNKVEVNPEIQSLIVTINNIIDEDHDADGNAVFSQVMQKIYNILKDFNPKNYGAINKQALPFFESNLSKYYEIIKDENMFPKYIKRKTKK